MQYNVIRNNVVVHNGILHIVMQYNVIRPIVMQYNVERYNVIVHNGIRHIVMQYNVIHYFFFFFAWGGENAITHAQ